MGQVVGQLGTGPAAMDFVAACVRSPHVDGVVLAGGDPAARTALADRFGIIKRQLGDIDQLLAEAAIGAVALALPLADRPAAAQRLLAAGRDVIVPPPLAPDMVTAEAMVAAATGGGRRLMCAMPEPLLPAHARVRSLLEDGEPGEVRMVSVVDLAPQPPAADDWLLETAASLAAVAADWLGPVTAVTAAAVGARAGLTFECASGALCQATVCHDAVGDRVTGERRLVAESGSLLVRDNPEDDWPLVYLAADDFRPLKVKNPPEVRAWARREAMEQALAALLGPRPGATDLRAALHALAVALATVEAAATGCRVVIAEQA